MESVQDYKMEILSLEFCIVADVWKTLLYIDNYAIHAVIHYRNET
jgi:hypothetical protein